MFSRLTRHYFDTARGFGHLDSPTHQSCVGSPKQSHFFQLQLNITAAGLIEDLAFQCPRCVPAIACGAYLYEQLVGHPSDTIAQLTLEALLTALGGIPPPRLFYAWMAIQAAQQAQLSERRF